MGSVHSTANYLYPAAHLQRVVSSHSHWTSPYSTLLKHPLQQAPQSEWNPLFGKEQYGSGCMAIVHCPFLGT